MLDNDNLTYSNPKRAAVSTSSRHLERVLITADRSQKLDLLIHLLTNLQQSLVVCGPEGIGKTTLLKTLQASHKDIWPICIVQGSSALSFESIIAQLSQFLNLSSTSIHFDMSSLRAFCGKQKVVLIIDDAGDMVPGLIGELIDFADSLSGLRLVFSMDYDEFQTKSSSDKAVDGCHYIELPPLNQRQCLEYLQNLSVQPDTQLSFKAITDELVEDIYRQTQGIPGKLLAELPKLDQYQGRQQRKLGLWIGVPLILVAAGFAAKTLLPPSALEGLFSLKPTEPVQSVSEKAAVEPIAEPEPASVDMHGLTPASALLPEPLLSQSIPITPEAPDEPLSPDTQPDTTKITEAPGLEPSVAPPPAIEPKAEPATPPAVVATVVQPLPAETPPIETKPVAVIPAEKPAIAKTTPRGDNLSWIMAQPANNYTVQIMVLSSKDSANRFIKKYAEYGDNLQYYPIGKEGQEKYVLIYGSFESSTDALNAKSSMPEDFKQGLVKRFQFVQRESRRK